MVIIVLEHRTTWRY